MPGGSHGNADLVRIFSYRSRTGKEGADSTAPHQLIHTGLLVRDDTSIIAGWVGIDPMFDAMDSEYAGPMNKNTDEAFADDTTTGGIVSIHRLVLPQRVNTGRYRARRHS